MEANSSMWSMLLMIVAMVAIFYFLVIRPNKKQQDAHKKLLEGLRQNDVVVTTSGIHGTVARINDDTVMVKVSDRTEIEFSKNAIQLVNPGASGSVSAAGSGSGAGAGKSAQQFEDDDEDFMTEEEIAEKRRKKKLKKDSDKESD
ncbi:MAG: preprotein translocase subunit YajC [Peptococcaceae bacterium]|nr:preprotein translocase subunit YajC [Peptococcaceae bacterium]